MSKKVTKRLLSVLCLILVFTFFVSSGVLAAADGKKIPNVVTTYEPPCETTVNGVPESEIIRPMVIFGDPYFVDATPYEDQHIEQFKKIGQTYCDNRYNSQPTTLTFNITQSSSSGSEFSGSFTMNGTFQTALVAKLGAELGLGLKLTRSTNEAVGASASTTVPAYMQGKIEAWWGGLESGEYVTYKQGDTGSEDGWFYSYDNDVSSRVHTTWFDVNFFPTVY